MSSTRRILRYALHTVIGAVLLAPYAFLYGVVLPVAAAAMVIWIGIPAVLIVLGLTRSIADAERRLANSLLGTAIAKPPRVAELAGGAMARLRALVSHGATWRGFAYLILRSVVGLAGFLTLLVGLTSATVLVAAPFGDGFVSFGGGWQTPSGPGTLWTWPLAVVVAVVTTLLCAALAALLRFVAPPLLGPSTADEVRRLKAQTAQLSADALHLALQNRTARDLHDSVGHTMTTVVVQAAAARRVFDRDPDFARQALGEIEVSARRALDELDGVLASLRAGGGPSVAGPGATANAAPTLADLDQLFGATRSAGLPLRASVAGDVAQVPDAVSTVAFRIVQEGLTNVLRHAGQPLTTVTVEAADGEVTVAIENAAGTGAALLIQRPGRAGSGLAGIGARVRELGGRIESGPAGGGFVVRARLPCRP